MSIHDIAREPAGRPTGGQFAATVKAASGISLQHADDAEAEYLADLREQDRPLATAILDPMTDLVGNAQAAGQSQFDYLSSFGGAHGPDRRHEIAEIADRLVIHHDLAVSSRFSRSPADGDLWEVSTYLGGGARLTRQMDITALCDDREADGMDAALAYARAIDEEMTGLIRHRDELNAPGPTLSEMRAAVQVDDWRGAEAKVRFVREEGAEIEQAHIRTGRWTAEGHPASAALPDGREHVRMTMSTGVERFVPFSEMQAMVAEHRMAEGWNRPHGSARQRPAPVDDGPAEPMPMAG